MRPSTAVRLSVLIGASVTSLTTFAGSIDEFRLWSVARSGNDLAADALYYPFVTPATSIAAGVLVYLPFHTSSPSHTGGDVLATSVAAAVALDFTTQGRDATVTCSSVCVVLTTRLAGRCGDGVRAAAEECDDGNSINGDGCTSLCALEKGFGCISVGRTSADACYNGIVGLVERFEGSSGVREAPVSWIVSLGVGGSWSTASVAAFSGFGGLQINQNAASTAAAIMTHGTTVVSGALTWFSRLLFRFFIPAGAAQGSWSVGPASSELAVGSFASFIFPGYGSYVHTYHRHSVRLAMLDARTGMETLNLYMKASDGGGNGVGSLGSQNLVMRSIGLPTADGDAEVSRLESNVGDGWQLMKTFSAVTLLGDLSVMFDAYIVSGNDYFAYRIAAAGGTTLASAAYSQNVDSASPTGGPSVHSYVTFSVSIPGVLPNTVIMLYMKASDGSGNGVGSGASQYLMCKNAWVNIRTERSFAELNNGVGWVLMATVAIPNDRQQYSLSWLSYIVSGNDYYGLRVARVATAGLVVTISDGGTSAPDPYDCFATGCTAATSFRLCYNDITNGFCDRRSTVKPGEWNVADLLVSQLVYGKYGSARTSPASLRLNFASIGADGPASVYIDDIQVIHVGGDRDLRSLSAQSAGGGGTLGQASPDVYPHLKFPPAGSTTGERVEVSNFPMPSSDFSISLWMRSGSAQRGVVVSYASAAGGTTTEFQIDGYSASGLTVWIRGSSVSSTAELFDATWHHVGVTFVWTTGATTVFVDGTSVLVGNTGAGGRLLYTPGCLVFGQRQGSVCGGFVAANAFVGKIASISVWSLALSSAQVVALLSAPALGSEAGVVASWRSVTRAANRKPATLVDSSGSRANGVIVELRWVEFGPHNAFGSFEHPAPSCAHIRADRPNSADGNYWVVVRTSAAPMPVYCDMTTDGGGWTLVSVALVSQHGSSVWNGEGDLNIASSQDLGAHWHMSSGSINAIGGTKFEMRALCFNSANNYKRYWSNINAYWWGALADIDQRYGALVTASTQSREPHAILLTGRRTITV